MNETGGPGSLAYQYSPSPHYRVTLSQKARQNTIEDDT